MKIDNAIFISCWIFLLSIASNQTVKTDQITDLNRFYPSVLKATEKNPRLFLTKDCSHDRNGYDSHHLICHFITQP